MRRRNSNAVLNASSALNAENHCLSPVGIIYLIAGIEGAAEFIKFNKAVCLGGFFYKSRYLTLCFAGAQKLLISLAELITDIKLLVAHKVNAVFFFVKQHFLKLL